MEDNKFWLSIWRTIAIVVCIAVISVTSCSINRQVLVSNAIEAGKDPISVKCALETNTALEPACVLKASK